MTETKPKRRWFRFSLRTLLVVVTLAAMASWGHWVAWPWWLSYREQLQIIEEVKQLKAGMSIDEVESLPISIEYRRDWNFGGRYDIHATLFVCNRRYSTYCLYVQYSITMPPPPGGRVKSNLVQTELFKLPAGMLSGDGIGTTKDMGYSFLKVLNSRRKVSDNLNYVLVYSDPEAEPIK